MPKLSEAIANFLQARKMPNNADLIDRWDIGMECQINVAADNGEPVDGKRNTYTDGQYEWFNIRVPKNAAGDPEFKDYELRWPLDLHVEGIGMTGWCWSTRRSMWCAFDFDSITGHAKGIGISDEELERVKQAAMLLPYVEVRRSTGGAGIHLYVYFDEEGIPTENHTVHAALGRCALGMASSETGFDFASQIDACGGNMWFHHRKMTAENDGLKIIKPAEKKLTVADLPSNWRDHIEVVTRRRAKVRVHAELKDENLDPFEELTSARRIVPLDDTHKAVIDELSHSGFSTIWVSDHHLLQTHTCGLAKLMENKELKLQGIFKTISQGTHPETPNCFMFPLDKGGWRVYRFSPGVNEAETWNQDREGWTNCYFNTKPNLRTAARAMGAQEDPDQGGFAFGKAADAINAAKALGQKIELPAGNKDRLERLMGRKARLKTHKDGRLVMQISKKTGEKKPLQGWIDKGTKWVKVFDAIADTKKEDVSHAEYDNLIRQVVTPSREDAGWYLRASDMGWERYGTEKVKMRLIAMGNTKPQVELILGSTIGKAWKLVNVPFQPEYPGDRLWNMDAAQYAYPPAILERDETPHHPNWDRVLKHCGQDLDGVVRGNDWCKLHNIKTGADYLLHWIAFLLRDPFQPLPYLFLYGNQNNGKSILHQAIKLLMTKGVASADRALNSNNDFNGELANCVLAYIEETDLSSNDGKAYNRIKDWTTNDELWIRRMRTDAYKQRNTLHFIQTGNKLRNLYLESNDTRIVVIFVPDLAPGEEIPKNELIAKLKDEAPHFMRTVMDLTLPSPHSRMGLPPLRTRNKERAEEINSNPLETFIAEQCYQVPGEMVEFAEFYKRFLAWLPEERRYAWKKSIVLDEIKQRFPYGGYTGNKRMVGNLSFEARTPEPGVKPWISVDNWLVRKEEA